MTALKQMLLLRQNFTSIGTEVLEWELASGSTTESVKTALPLRQPFQHRMKAEAARAHQGGAEHFGRVAGEFP